MKRIVIEGEIHSSKNSRQIIPQRGRVFLTKSPAAKADEQSFAWQLNAQRETWLQMTDEASYPLRVVFFFKRRTHGIFDYANIVQGLQDAMVKAGYIPDDSADYLIPVFTPYTVDKKNPGCEFYLSEYNPKEKRSTKVIK